MTTLSPDKKIKQNPDIAWRILGDYMIAITPTDNNVHRFNKTGAFFWKCLDGKTLTIREIINSVKEEFEIENKIDEQNLESDMEKFANEIYQKGLIEIESKNEKS